MNSTARLAVGTPVTVDKPYGDHPDYTDRLVVLNGTSDLDGMGYGVGRIGNNPDKGHDGHKGWLYYSKARVHPKPTAGETTVIANDFKVGDKVEYLQDHDGFKQGTQAKVIETGSLVTVVHADGADNMLLAHRLRLVVDAPEFSYKDIREGDTIRRTKTYLSGATDTREGVAGHRGSYYWAEAGNSFILAYESDVPANVTLELVNRPEAPKPWEGAVPGTVLLRHNFPEGPETECPDHVIKLANGDWRLVYGSGVKSFTFGDRNAVHYLQGYKVTVAV